MTAQDGGRPRARAAATPADRTGGRALTVLRATAYVLTSLASLVFLALVVYGAVQLNRLQETFPALPGS